MNKTEILTLLCEWNDCMNIYEDVNTFISHITTHLEDLNLSIDIKFKLSENKNSEDEFGSSNEFFVCYWRDCSEEDSFNSMEDLSRHVYYHAFHQRIKCKGIQLLKKSKLQVKCEQDSWSRNHIPNIPCKFICYWNNCQMQIDIAEHFYNHVAEHTEIYQKGKFLNRVCQCKWLDCKVSVKSRHRLREHLRSHTKEKFLACPTCGSLFANGTRFLDHIRNKQQVTEENSFKCSYCDKTFALESTMINHQNHHIYRYKCPFCEMLCTYRSSLRMHILYKHTLQRPYLCQFCEFSAKLPVDLRRHDESHNNDWVMCEEENCSFRTKFEWDLNLHNRLEHQGKDCHKYSCHLCTKKFRRGNLLSRHFIKKHDLQVPPGHYRFRFKQDKEDGYFRLFKPKIKIEKLIVPVVAFDDNSKLKRLKCSDGNLNFDSDSSVVKENDLNNNNN